jgi:hypothetical protein
MRHLLLLLLLSFFGLNLTACAQKTTVQKTTIKKSSQKTPATKKPASSEVGPVLVFERTPCYGTCPAYVMQVYTDGRVAYEGRHSVPMMGKQDLQLPANAVADMLRQAKEAHFEAFEKVYSGGATDLPSTIVTIRQPDGMPKKVIVEGNAPENVRAFFTSLSSQFDVLAQLNGTDR